MNTIEIDLSEYESEEHMELINEICKVKSSRLIFQNVSEYMNHNDSGKGFGMLRIHLEAAMDYFAGCLINSYIYGAGMIERVQSGLVSDELKGYYTSIYYPEDDKIILVEV